MTVSDVDNFKPLYKAHRRIPRDEVPVDVLDLTELDRYEGPYSLAKEFFTKDLHKLNDILTQYDTSSVSSFPVQYSVREIPGLVIIPELIPTNVQKVLIEEILTQHIPPAQHQSNLDLHYNLPRPLDILSKHDIEIPSKDPSKPNTSLFKVRDKQLRWITLGGQYNWTTKVYPTFKQNTRDFPMFPSKLNRFLNALFPTCKPEAAIINFYSPGDILSPHQDVAEISTNDLISLSLGCECIFYIGVSRSSVPLQIILRSGDVIVMGKGPARQAFHGVGRVWRNTISRHLAEDDKYGEWLTSKRINLNVRQVL
jgi:alkylated DNA repair protein alkB family protein 1